MGRTTVIIVLDDDGSGVAWRQATCCGMWFTAHSPAFDSGELLRTGLQARHAQARWCVQTRPWREALPVCYTCEDTGMVHRADGSTALCPQHCDAAWVRLEASLA